MVMANLNKVMLIGNLTRDPELRYLQKGTAVCSFGLAVNRKYGTASGEQKEEVLFIDVTAFGKQAEVVSEFLQKGRPVYVEGRLKLDQWTGQDGQKRSRMTVVMERFQFLDSRPREGGAAKTQPDRTQPDRTQPDKTKPPETPADEFDAADDSIPF
jgi:single-strand DNA-binding protein